MLIYKSYHDKKSVLTKATSAKRQTRSPQRLELLQFDETERIKRKLRRVIIPRNQEGYKKPLFKGRRFSKHQISKTKTKKELLKRWPLRKPRSHKGLPGSSLGRSSQLLTNPSGQE